jgi:hypothetical protein
MLLWLLGGLLILHILCWECVCFGSHYFLWGMSGFYFTFFCCFGLRIIWLSVILFIYLFIFFVLFVIKFSLSSFGLWFISCLAETNQTAFDFAEGESELVSGFNVEHGRGGLALIFFCFMRRLFCVTFLGNDFYFF